MKAFCLPLQFSDTQPPVYSFSWRCRSPSGDSPQVLEFLPRPFQSQPPVQEPEAQYLPAPGTDLGLARVGWGLRVAYHPDFHL